MERYTFIKKAQEFEEETDLLIFHMTSGPQSYEVTLTLVIKPSMEAPRVLQS